MKQRFLDLWVKPIVEHPRTTLAGFASILVLFLPHHGAQISAAAAAIGLIFAGDATSAK